MKANSDNPFAGLLPRRGLTYDLAGLCCYERHGKAPGKPCRACLRTARRFCPILPDVVAVAAEAAVVAASYRRVWKCRRCRVELMEAPIAFEGDVDAAALG